MNEKETKKKREWVKNAAIVFLSIMLVLTFFSNTIMNYSLPEVATQYVQRGTITAKVRGTGNVEAADPYNVMVKESRVISSVAVKQGDTVEKDQVLYYLEDAESDELTKAKDELEELELNYMKGLFGANVSPEIISKVANGNVDGFSALQAKVTDMQNRLDAAQARVKECQDNLDKLNLQSTTSSNDATVNTIPYENEVTQSTTNLENAQTAESNAQQEFENEKARQLAALNNQIAEKQKEISDLETLVSNGQNVTGSTGGSTTTGGGTVTPTPTPTPSNYVTDKTNAEQAVVNALNDIIEAANNNNPSYGGTKVSLTIDPQTKLSNYNQLDINNKFKSVNDWITANKKESDYQSLLAAYYAARTQLENVNSQQQQIIHHDSNANQLAAKKKELADLQAAVTALTAVTYQSGEGVQNAKNRLNQATQNLTEIKNANSQASVAWQNKIANAEAALKAAQAVYDMLKEEQTQLSADINAELDLSKASKDIKDKKEEIAKLEEKSMGAAVTAPVAGTVSSLAYVAGETTKPEEAAAVILPEGKGFSLSFSVTNEQAKKVQVGDVAELQNSWYYDDAQVILTAIKPDTEDPGKKKLLVFSVTGASIQNGQALSVSVGQRSAEYDLVVPNSAIREDNNGKFVLIVESKSSPLGNRYIATRVDVQVQASDDNNTAITAPLTGYEYVITTSNKPVEAGKQVRLNES
mgnify:FL=1